MRFFSLFILTLFAFNHLNAIPPDPPKGQRWIVNEQCSDEFDGTNLSGSKWNNTSSRWIGRAPGLFQKEAMSVGEGNMRLTQSKLATPVVVNGNTFTHSGGHIISKNKVQPGSYIECRMKANKTFMSSTFWLINYSNENSGCDRRTTELDVQECVGQVTGGNTTATERMGSNTHSRGIPATCDIPAGSVGNHVTLPTKAYEEYYTYAVWWKDPKEILFYLNGEYQYTITPVAPFSNDLYVKLVTETYDWNPPPSDGGMNKPWDERTTFYDYVRTYTLLDVNTSSAGDISVMFTENVAFTMKPAVINNTTSLKMPATYKANDNREISLSILTESEEVIIEKVFSAKSGYGYTDFLLSVEDKLQEKTPYKAKIYIRPVNSSDNDDAYASDEFMFEVSNPKELSFSLINSQTNRPIRGAEITLNDVIQLSDANGSSVFSNVPVDTYPMIIQAFGYKSVINNALYIEKDDTLEFALVPEAFRQDLYVKDSLTNAPVKDVILIIDGVARKTDSNGKIFFNTFLGKYPLEIRHEQYGYSNDSINIVDGSDLNILLPRLLTDVQFNLELDGTALGYAQVVLGDQSKQSSFSGKASFTKVPSSTDLSYAIIKNEKTLNEGIINVYNDTIVNISLSSTPIKKTSQNELFVYPNPAKQLLFVSGLQSSSSYTLMQLSGKLVSQGDIFPNEAITIDELANGMYILRLENGERITFVKL